MDPKAKRFVECVIAPDYEPHALDALKKWKENVRLLKTGELTGGPQGLDYRRVDGGLLVQTRDDGADEPDEWKVRHEAQADRGRVPRAALRVVRLQAREERTRSCWRTRHAGRRRRGRADEPRRFGRDRGEEGRRPSRRAACWRRTRSSRSRDNVDAAAAAGVTAIIQPGGSVKDADSIAACDEHGIAMLFTGVRHFRH